MYKACSRCGKIHSANFKCNAWKEYNGGEERKLRNTYAWAKKSEEVRADANYLCEVCRAHNVYNYTNLSVHHIVKLKEDSTKLLEDDNLICLCAEHHKMADEGEIDADYLRQLVKNRHRERIPPHHFEKKNKNEVQNQHATSKHKNN